MRVIPIFFTIDGGYIPYLECAIRSMKENASKNYKYIINVIYEKVLEEDIDVIKKLSDEKFEIVFSEMKNDVKSLTENKDLMLLRGDYFTMTIFFRLFISEMFPQYDKGIYIDSDVIIPGDISKLFEIDLGDNLIGACPDKSVVNVKPLANYMEKAIGIDPHCYINSGMLLMNLKKMREVGFTKHFIYLLDKYHFKSVAPDQDYLNAMACGKIKFLDEKWDAMPPEGIVAKEIEDPQIIHYNLFQKPWCYDNVAYGDFFWKVAKNSPFYDRILDNKNNYDDKKKEADRKSLEGMFRTADEISENETVTMKAVEKSGEKIKVW